MKVAESLARGEPNRAKVALTALSDKVRELVQNPGPKSILNSMGSRQKAAEKDSGKNGKLPFSPEDGISLTRLRRAARGCKACDLWKNATQTIFGEGPPNSRIMFVGEQPGDREDLAGRPFVGPAGKLLDKALAEVGIGRGDVYVTNIVKHFKWSPAERGKRRIHKKPRSSEINACRPWLDAELGLVKPDILVCLGATAAQSLLGRDFSVKSQRGRLIRSQLAPFVVATVHPSSILRAPDDDSRREQMQAFVRDLDEVASLLKSERSKSKF
ncbi:MAG: UdgX family uracil-DNA binding protein [Terriglobales bacterium]